ncbi:MAG: hypothetical protein ACKPKO_56030 [Candidatus Fonsibacter sp.]
MNPPEVKNKDSDPTLIWSTIGSPIVFNIMCKSQALSKWLCVALLDYDVQLAAGKATINFKFSKVTPLNSEWSAKFAQHMICDVSHELTPTSSASTQTGWVHVEYVARKSA